MPPIITLVRANLSITPWASYRAYKKSAVSYNKEKVTVISANVVGTPIFLRPFSLLVFHFFKMSVQIEQVPVLRFKFDAGHEATFELGDIQGELAIFIIRVEQA